jgi:hypothetical protein
MNKWDKVEKTKRQVTQSDILWLKIKMVLWVVGGFLYGYYVILGNPLF